MANRVLGIDFGTKRIGVALSDDAGTMAFPHATLDAGDNIIEKIRVLCEREGVSEIIVGLPQSLATMADTDSTRTVRDFAKRLETIGLPVAFEPEFLSTREAAGGLTKKEHIDAAAAAIILQSYLERKKNMIQ